MPAAQTDGGDGSGSDVPWGVMALALLTAGGAAYASYRAMSSSSVPGLSEQLSQQQLSDDEGAAEAAVSQEIQSSQEAIQNETQAMQQKAAAVQEAENQYQQDLARESSIQAQIAEDENQLQPIQSGETGILVYEDYVGNVHYVPYNQGSDLGYIVGQDFSTIPDYDEENALEQDINESDADLSGVTADLTDLQNEIDDDQLDESNMATDIEQHQGNLDDEESNYDSEVQNDAEQEEAQQELQQEAEDPNILNSWDNTLDDQSDEDDSEDEERQAQLQADRLAHAQEDQDWGQSSDTLGDLGTLGLAFVGTSGLASYLGAALGSALSSGWAALFGGGGAATLANEGQAELQAARQSLVQTLSNYESYLAERTVTPGAPYTASQQAIVDLAQEAKNTGVTVDEAQALLDLAQEFGFLPQQIESHAGRAFGQYLHFQIGPIDHIFIKP